MCIRDRISGLRLAVVGRNLAILHQNTPKGIDPEASSSSGNAQGIEYGGIDVYKRQRMIR